MRADPRAIEELGNCDSEDDDDDNWMPAPSDADPGTIKPNFPAFNNGHVYSNLFYYLKSKVILLFLFNLDFILHLTVHSGIYI